MVYRRHTNFAIESIQQTFNGTAGFDRRVTTQISRNGDLIHRIYLQIDVPDLNNAATWVPYLGLKLIKDVEIEIGGQRIDKHYSDFMYIWNELSLPKGKRDGWDMMVGASVDNNSTSRLYVPLEFWFCRNVGLALPLIALIARAEKHHPSCKSLVHEEKRIYGSMTKELPKVLVGVG